MSTTTRPDAETFLREFFSPPNRLKLNSKPEIPTWADRLRGTEPLPTVLPCWRPDDAVDWYGLAFNDRQLRALGESLTAFVGPTYTTFRGQLAKLDGADPVDQAVLRFTSGLAFKFRGTDPKEIWIALERMRKVWARRGPRERPTPEPVGRVLRDFYMALRTGDADQAEEQLGRLREEYHLDGVNLLYLRVQLLAELRRWDDLLQLAELPDLLRLRRPAAVTEAILRAVYQTSLARFEDPPLPEQAVAAFRAEVLPRFGAIFASRAGMQSPEAIKGFMLLAVTREPADLALRDELLAAQGLLAADEQYLNKLAALMPSAAPPKPADALRAAAGAAHANDFDRAFSLARTAAPSPARARLLCECAAELATLEAKAVAVEAVNALCAEERHSFLERRVNQQLWESLSDLGGGEEPPTAEMESVPTDWCLWLEHLDRHEGKAGSREIARRGSTEWSVAEFLEREGTVVRLLEKLHGKRSQAAERVLRDCLPHLLAFFGKDSRWPNAELRGVYRALLDLLFFSTDGGRADLAVFNELLEALLALGVAGADEYRELVAYARDLWDRYASPATLDWVTDTLGTLVAHPTPDGDARRSLCHAVFAGCVRFHRHVPPEARDLLQLIAKDIGEEKELGGYFPPADNSAAGEEDPFGALAGKAVAVYTLTERAGRQLKQVLEGRVVGVSVSLCHDQDGSKRLKQLARQADLFVVVTASAKHAATDCIDASRGKELPTVRPTGKGAASMLRAIREHLER